MAHLGCDSTLSPPGRGPRLGLMTDYLFVEDEVPSLWMKEESLSLSLYHVRPQPNGGCKSEESSPKTDPAEPGFEISSLQNCENINLFFKLPNLWYFVMASKKTNTWMFYSPQGPRHLGIADHKPESVFI